MTEIFLTTVAGWNAQVSKTETAFVEKHRCSSKQEELPVQR